MKGDTKMKKDDNYLEFYQKATELRKELRKRKKFWYVKRLEDIVLLYFRNGNKFPNTITIENATYRRMDFVKEILMKLGFFEKHSIDEYEFIKKKERKKGIVRDTEYNEYSFVISLKKDQ